MEESPSPLPWLLLHPLGAAVLAGVLADVPELGVIVGVTLTPLVSDRDDPEVGAAVAFGAVLVAGHLSAARGAGGILNESWVAAVLALATMLVPLLVLAQLHSTLIGRSVRSLVTLVCVVAVGWVVRLPSASYGLAPWVAGGLFVVGLGRLAGSPADPTRSARRLATVAALLACNVLGAAALLVLPAAWFAAEQARSREPSGRLLQGLTALGALVAAFVLGWLPYQLPAWPEPMIQLPSGDVVVHLSQTTLVLPLFALGASLYAGWGALRSE
jgi:hypothetical protein